ncbi:TadE/TadG family type IV pilus assembly protein [Antrihabitans spumae]|uniref:TadE/TadG family type IV pilus assembly protein n=1 Tax=Antrihabitans spumae TaxID=3373370 RepID=A0ABW7KD53_9NOCA
MSRLTTWIRRTAQRGNTIAFAILIPLAIIMLFLGVQGALYYHARSVAVAAAEEALKQSASQYGNPAAGTAAGYAFIAQAGGTTLQAPAVAVTRGPRNSTVSITGKSISLLWFWHPTVHIDMAKPVERITTPGIPS